ncbi:MAG: hypothetical protein ACXVEF_13060 [Polyangiales bacterium]
MALTAVVLFSSACFPQYRAVTAGWWGGGDHYYSADYQDNQWQGHEVDVVRDQAARDFGCAVDSVVADRPHQRVWVAAGCGHHAPYLLVVLAGSGQVVPPGRAESAYVTWIRAINLASPSSPAPLPSTIHSSSDPMHDAKPWIDLVAQGAKDLECPADQITPDYVPQGKAPALPLAEGCGKRATYVSESDPKALRLSSVVTIK